MDNLRYKLALTAVYATIGFLMLWSVAAHSAEPDMKCYQPRTYLSDLLVQEGFTLIDAFKDDAGVVWLYWYRRGEMIITVTAAEVDAQCIYLHDKDLPRRWRHA